MEITSVSVRYAPMASNWLTEQVIANPMSIYPEYVDRRSSWYRTMTAGVVEITTSEGISGLGFIGSGKARAAEVLLDEQIRDLLIGKNAFATELISEQLHRASVYYGRGGTTQALLSGIDIALWDIKGKAAGQPVYELLGGPTRPVLKPYLTSWDSEALEEFGIRDVKIAVPYGPAHGEEGMRANEEAVRAARETIGPDGFIALDCYMAWDVPYTIEMDRRLKDYRIKWIEEPVFPDDIDGYRRITDKIDTEVSGGEHTYTLEGFHRLIHEGGISLVQPDIYRAGGPTVLKKVAALAEATNTKLMCHGVGLATFHFMMSNPHNVSPRCEYLDVLAGSAVPWVFKNEPRPKNGVLEIPDTPGFGFTLDEAAFEDGAEVAPIW